MGKNCFVVVEARNKIGNPWTEVAQLRPPRHSDLHQALYDLCDHMRRHRYPDDIDQYSNRTLMENDDTDFEYKNAGWFTANELNLARERFPDYAQAFIKAAVDFSIAWVDHPENLRFVFHIT